MRQELPLASGITALFLALAQTPEGERAEGRGALRSFGRERLVRDLLAWDSRHDIGGLPA